VRPVASGCTEVGGALPSPLVPPRRLPSGTPSDPVAALLTRAAAGHPPPADRTVTVLPQPPGPVAGILAFTEHHVVAADVDPDWVHRLVPRGDLSAPLAPAFVSALGEALGRSADNIDVVLVTHGAAGDPPLALVTDDGHGGHPRVERSSRYRSEVEVHATPDGAGVLVLGRGLAGRWEVAFEVDPSARGQGLGRALAGAARHLVPVGEPLFVQVAPGNVPSLRAVLAAGFVPVGGEILFPG
jgi:GNAT superfamily N-acetyltransferase